MSTPTVNSVCARVTNYYRSYTDYELDRKEVSAYTATPGPARINAFKELLSLCFIVNQEELGRNCRNLKRKLRTRTLSIPTTDEKRVRQIVIRDARRLNELPFTDEEKTQLLKIVNLLERLHHLLR